MTSTTITRDGTLQADLDKEWSVIATHERAVETLHAARSQVGAISAAYGKADPRTIEATTSLMAQAISLFGGFFGSLQKITRDGELSLFVQTSSGFVYGLIFHASYYDSLHEHPDAYNNSGGAKVTHVHCRTCDEPVKRTEPDAHNGEGHLLMLAPTPGTWSFHS